MKTTLVKWEHSAISLIKSATNLVVRLFTATIILKALKVIKRRWTELLVVVFARDPDAQLDMIQLERLQEEEAMAQKQLLMK